MFAGVLIFLAAWPRSAGAISLIIYTVEWKHPKPMPDVFCYGFTQVCIKPLF